MGLPPDCFSDYDYYSDYYNDEPGTVHPQTPPATPHFNRIPGKGSPPKPSKRPSNQRFPGDFAYPDFPEDFNADFESFPFDIGLGGFRAPIRGPPPRPLPHPLPPPRPLTPRWGSSPQNIPLGAPGFTFPKLPNLKSSHAIVNASAFANLASGGLVNGYDRYKEKERYREREEAKENEEDDYPIHPLQNQHPSSPISQPSTSPFPQSTFQLSQSSRITHFSSSSPSLLTSPPLSSPTRSPTTLVLTPSPTKHDAKFHPSTSSLPYNTLLSLDHSPDTHSKQDRPPSTDSSPNHPPNADSKLQHRSPGSHSSPDHQPKFHFTPNQASNKHPSPDHPLHRQTVPNTNRHQVDEQLTTTLHSAPPRPTPTRQSPLTRQPPFAHQPPLTQSTTTSFTHPITHLPHPPHTSSLPLRHLVEGNHQSPRPSTPFTGLPRTPVPFRTPKPRRTPVPPRTPMPSDSLVTLGETFDQNFGFDPESVVYESDFRPIKQAPPGPLLAFEVSSSDIMPVRAPRPPPPPPVQSAPPRFASLPFLAPPHHLLAPPPLPAGPRTTSHMRFAHRHILLDEGKEQKGEVIVPTALVHESAVLGPGPAPPLPLPVPMAPVVPLLGGAASNLPLIANRPTKTYSTHPDHPNPTVRHGLSGSMARLGRPQQNQVVRQNVPSRRLVAALVPLPDNLAVPVPKLVGSDMLQPLLPLPPGPSPTLPRVFTSDGRPLPSDTLPAPPRLAEGPRRSTATITNRPRVGPYRGEHPPPIPDRVPLLTQFTRQRRPNRRRPSVALPPLPPSPRHHVAASAPHPALVPAPAQPYAPTRPHPNPASGVNRTHLTILKDVWATLTHNQPTHPHDGAHPRHVPSNTPHNQDKKKKKRRRREEPLPPSLPSTQGNAPHFPLPAPYNLLLPLLMAQMR